MKKTIIFNSLLLLSLSSVGQVFEGMNFKIKSNSLKFAEAELGKEASLYGKKRQSESGDDFWFETKNKVILDTEMFNKNVKYLSKITLIKFNCINKFKSIGDASIDGVNCNDTESSLKGKISNYKELCTTEELEIRRYYISLNNAYFLIDKKTKPEGQIISMGLVENTKLLNNRHEDPYIDCSEAKKLINKAKLEGYQSVFLMIKAQENNKKIELNKQAQKNQDTKWYAIPKEIQYESTCINFDVKEFVKNLMSLNRNHVVNEVEVSNGLPVVVEIIIRESNEREINLTAYKGLDRCMREFNFKKKELEDRLKSREIEIKNKINRF